MTPLISGIEAVTSAEDLLRKYVRHIRFHEGIDYLSEGRAVDSCELTEKEIEQILKIVNRK